MLLKCFMVLSALVLVSACAKKPEDIAAAFVSPSMYDRSSCNQLAAERNAVFTALNEATAAQQRARGNDTAIVTASILLLPIAGLFAMGGSDYETQIASLRGQMNAIDATYRAKSC